MKLTKLFSIDILFLGLVGLILGYLISLDNLNVCLIFGLSILAGYILHLEMFHGKLYLIIFSVLISLALIYLLGYDSSLTATFLLGINFTTLYFQIRHYDKSFLNIQLINVSVVASLIFLSAIEKFRGYNKVDPASVAITIPMLILLPLAVAVLMKAFTGLLEKSTLKDPINKRFYVPKVIAAFLIINGLHFLIAYYFYKEIGIDIIFLPLISGTIAALCNLLLRSNSFTNNILEVFLIAIIPYKIGGFGGIALALIASTLFINFVGRLLLDKHPSLKQTIYKMAPLIFLFATTEIRENRGLITRFNLSTGYQAGWLLIGIVVLEYFYSFIKKIIKLLANNEIPSMLSFVGTLFTIILFTIIIKIGQDEAVVSFLVSCVIYLILLSVLDYKRYKDRMRLGYALANCIGVLSFLILTRI